MEKKCLRFEVDVIVTESILVVEHRGQVLAEQS